MIKVGVTGNNGFIGYHLSQSLKLKNDRFELIEFNRLFFTDESKLDDFVKKCNVIVHLAGINRHPNPEIIYKVNVNLAEILIESLERTNSKAHVIFSSSIHEELNNHYGSSKLKCRKILLNWSKKAGTNFSGLIIPNVFGPFCNPFYNSVVSTFSHLLSIGQNPEIQVDKELNLIYVGDLVNKILEVIELKLNSTKIQIQHTNKIFVSEILNLLKKFNQEYRLSGKIPEFLNSFEKDLFNTFRSYINYIEHFPVKYFKNIDNRGVFVEIIRNSCSGQTSFSTTKRGITRGNHFHTKKIERFAVIKGKAQIQLRKIGSDNVLNFYLDGDSPSYVDMPVWYTHNIKNIGEEDLITVFWIDEPYNIDKPDTYFEIV